MEKQTNVCLWGYTIYKDGTIIGRKGNQIRNTQLINVKWEERVFKNVSRARFVYWAFNQNFDFDDKNIYIVMKNSKRGYRLDNLKMVQKLEVVRGRKKLTDEEVEEIKRQHKEENRNYNALARRYGVSNTMIAYIINGYKTKY